MTPAEALDGPGIARGEALLLLAQATGRTRESLLAAPEGAMSPAAVARYAGLRERRLAGEPIAYLTGFREFYGRRFAVESGVLIPRPETELLIDLGLERIGRGRTAASPTVLDLGTGSGVLAITLALELAGACVTGTDLSSHALRVARSNAGSLGVTVNWQAGDWFGALDDQSRFDLIVSNPPYIAADDRHLHQGDLRFEPPGALCDGHDGLSALREIVAGSPARLNAGGTLMVEHGHDQAETVRALFKAAGLVDIASVRDLAGIERVTVGRLG